MHYLAQNGEYHAHSPEIFLEANVELNFTIFFMHKGNDAMPTIFPQFFAINYTHIDIYGIFEGNFSVSQPDLIVFMHDWVQNLVDRSFSNLELLTKSFYFEFDTFFASNLESGFTFLKQLFLKVTQHERQSFFAWPHACLPNMRHDIFSIHTHFVLLFKGMQHLIRRMVKRTALKKSWVFKILFKAHKSSTKLSKAEKSV